MPNPKEDENAQRAQKLFRQALEEARIEERNHENAFPRPFGGTSLYWQKSETDIELVLYSVKMFSGRLRASISLKGIAEQATRIFPNDVDAVNALVDVLKYIQATFFEILPRINQDLFERAYNLMLNRPTLSVKARRSLMDIHNTYMGAEIAAADERYKNLQKQLRAEQERTRRGGSEPDIEVSDEQCVKLSADYPALLQHWKNIKSWRKQGINWRTHAKVEFSDTPDDLLDRFDDDLPSQFDSDGEAYPNIPSALAHEHAARRCGIPPNAYSLSNLSRLRRRGNKIRGQSKIAND